MRIFLDKCRREKQNTYFVFKKLYPKIVLFIR